MRPTHWIDKAVISFSALIFLLIIPVLEVSSTHVYNPDWPGHARLHEVWQLFVHAGISILACVLVWKNQKLGLWLALILTASFLLAWLIQSTYGGSMLHSDGTEVSIGGFNLGVIVMLVNAAALSSAIFFWAGLATNK